MAAPWHPSVGMMLGLGAFIVWRMASRMRRLVGRQRLSPRRPWVAVIAFPLIALLLLFAALGRPAAAAGLVCGGVVGIGLGFWGLRLTRFEATPQGRFYTPNPYLGATLAILLIARLGWRFVHVYALGAPTGDTASWGRSPLTLLVFGTLAGYYATYAAGLLRWKESEAAAPPSSPQEGRD